MAERLIKYMGTADERVVAKGTDFDGRLRSGLDHELVFNAANKWVVDVGDVDPDVVDLLLEDDTFKDVTDLKLIPSNDHQKMFLGHKSKEAAPVSVSNDDDQNPPGGAGDAGAATTVGGSTEGGTPASGGTRGRRGGGTTTGGAGSD